jgi:hypothetical protein
MVRRRRPGVAIRQSAGSWVAMVVSCFPFGHRL